MFPKRFGGPPHRPLYQAPHKAIEIEHGARFRPSTSRSLAYLPAAHRSVQTARSSSTSTIAFALYANTGLVGTEKARHNLKSFHGVGVTTYKHLLSFDGTWENSQLCRPTKKWRFQRSPVPTPKLRCVAPYLGSIQQSQPLMRPRQHTVPQPVI